MKQINTVLMFLPVLALGFLLTGCDDDEGSLTSPIPDMGEGAMIRVVHASPDAPAVDIYAEGVELPLFTNVGYGTATDYLEVDAGTYNIQLRGTGSSPTSAPAFETGSLVIPDEATITALAVGLLASAPGADDAFRVMPLVESFDTPAAGNAVVRIIHGSADAPSVALDIGNDGTPEIADFARFADSGAGGVSLPAGTELQVGVWAGSPLARVTAFTTPALPEGAELFLVATGLLDRLPREDDGFGLLAIGPAGAIGLIRQNPVVFALHASPDAPAVDIAAGGALLAENLAFSELSAPIQVPPAAYTLGFQATGSGVDAATATTPELQAGQRYLAVASGFLGDMSFTLLPYGEGFDEAGSALVRVVHASPDAPEVDLGLWDGSSFTKVDPISDLAFGDASAAGGVDLGTAMVDVGVAPSGTTEPVAVFGLTPPSGLRAFAVAAGSLFDESAESFRLLLVDTAQYPWTRIAEVMPQ